MTCKKLHEILTPREMEFARLVAECFMNKEIADALGTSERYVKVKLFTIYAKLGLTGEGYLKCRMLLAMRYDREYRERGTQC